jgi:RNA polymerase sigma-70 factor (ECF subfamily)
LVSLVKDRTEEIQKLVKLGATRLVSRAQDNRSVKVEDLTPRIFAAVEKYLLRDDPSCSSEDIEQFIDGLQADDLCLIVACERSDEKAWTDLVERFTATVRSAARSASANEDAAEDLVQSIWAELYGLRMRDDGKRASKLAYYSGRGSLAGWLRAVVAQLAVDSFRKQSRLVQAEEDNELDRLAQEVSPQGEGPLVLVATTPSPEETVTAKLTHAHLEDAVSRALQNLGPDDRLLVKLYYFDNLRLKEAGAVMGVHEATASRRLSRIHNDLRKQVSEILIKEKGWTKAETEQSFAEAAQQLDSDLGTLLRNESVS